MYWIILIIHLSHSFFPFIRTGPAAQINFMGYARGGQTGHGIHLRLRSRAFIIAEQPSDKFFNDLFSDNVTEEVKDELSSLTDLIRLRWTKPSAKSEAPPPSRISHIDPEKAICFVSIDAGMVGYNAICSFLALVGGDQ